MTTTYYAPPDHFQGNVVLLPKEEALHATKVLRQKVGDEIVVVDGKGGWHRVILKSLNRDKVLGEIIETVSEVGESKLDVTIGLALLKNANRFEVFLEKAVELGVTAIQPLLTHRTEIQKFKEDRFERILVAAMKQCGRSRLPLLHPPKKLSEVLQHQGINTFICHEQIEISKPLWAEKMQENAPIVILVGPEGGFTEEEMEIANGLNWRCASLGGRRLRAETAAIVAASMMLLHE